MPEQGRWRPATLAREMPSIPADSAAFEDAVFVWRPESPGPWSFLATVSARHGDQADCCLLEAPGIADYSPIDGRDRVLWALAPYDNNLAVRSIASAAGSGGAKALSLIHI